MNTKQKWPLVILIVSLQLAALLLAVVFLFDWFKDRTETTLAQQVIADNQTIGQQFILATDFSRTSHGFQANDPASVDKVRKRLNRLHLPNNGVIALIAADTGKTLIHNSILFRRELNWGNLNVVSTSDSCPTNVNTVKNSVSPSSRNTGGRVRTDKGEFFVSTQLLPGDDAILLVAQQRSQVMSKYGSILAIMRRIVFGATLLLGLICVGATTSILSRFDEKVSSINNDLEKQVSAKTRELVKTRNAVIFGLAKLAESRDNDTGEHLDRIRTYVTILANDLASQYPFLDEEFVHNLGLASSLHDIGKVGIPDSILLKPGRLTPEERSVMELHAVIGGECLDAIQERLGDNKFMKIAVQVTYSHHERWDGTGYPHKTAGEDIPLVARIVSVADVYDALTSKRPYKRAMSHLESKTIIVSGSGTQFDPEVVAAFLRHEDSFEAIAIKQQSLSEDQTKTDFQRRVEQFESPKLA